MGPGDCGLRLDSRWLGGTGSVWFERARGHVFVCVCVCVCVWTLFRLFVVTFTGERVWGSWREMRQHGPKRR
jgi:hypothetical protein